MEWSLEIRMMEQAQKPVQCQAADPLSFSLYLNNVIFFFFFEIMIHVGLV